MMPLHSNNVTDYTYSLDDITIDLNDVYTMDTSMLTDNISITDNTNFGPISTSSQNFYDDITLNNAWEELCEYIGIDVTQGVEDLDKMCERYPALQKALEQFKNTYNLVKDDWRNDND
jgi:hypothetical protein